MNTPAPRKLHVPGKLVITPPEPKPAPPPPPACVEARRRFIKYFLAITGALTLLGNLIAIIRCAWYSNAPDGTFFQNVIGFFMSISSFAMIEVPAFAILLIPARTSRGSLFQLVGLTLPLLIAISSCAFCWVDPDVAWGYGAFLAMLILSGGLFFYLPGFLLHITLTLISKYRNRA